MTRGLAALFLLLGACASEKPIPIQIPKTSDGCECYVETCALHGGKRTCLYFTRSCNDSDVDYCAGQAGKHAVPEKKVDETPDIPESTPFKPS